MGFAAQHEVVSKKRGGAKDLEEFLDHSDPTPWELEDDEYSPGSSPASSDTSDSDSETSTSDSDDDDLEGSCLYSSQNDCNTPLTEADDDLMELCESSPIESDAQAGRTKTNSKIHLRAKKTVEYRLDVIYENLDSMMVDQEQLPPEDTMAKSQTCDSDQRTNIPTVRYPATRDGHRNRREIDDDDEEVKVEQPSLTMEAASDVVMPQLPPDMKPGLSQKTIVRMSMKTSHTSRKTTARPRPSRSSKSKLRQPKSSVPPSLAHVEHFDALAVFFTLPQLPFTAKALCRPYTMAYKQLVPSGKRRSVTLPSTTNIEELQRQYEIAVQALKAQIRSRCMRADGKLEPISKLCKPGQKVQKDVALLRNLCDLRASERRRFLS